MEAALKSIAKLAKQHGIAIRENELAFVATRKFTLAHVPVAGIERYNDADFAKGAAIQVVLIQAQPAGEVPNGTYIVKAQFRAGASEGKVSLINATGKVVAQRELIIRTQRQAAVMFPDVYSGPPADIPVITSTHVWIGDQSHAGSSDPKYGHWGVDCSGWQPYRTLYFWA
jgi:hypothetical protein